MARTKTLEQEMLDKLAPKPNLLPNTQPTPTPPPTMNKPLEAVKPQNTTPKPSPTLGPKYDQSTGKPGAFTYPDGRTIVGLSQKEIDFLNKKYSDYKLPGLTQEQQIQAELDRAKLKQQIEAAQTPTNVTQDQLNQVGNIPIQDTMDAPLTQAILANQQNRANINKIPIVNLLGKITNMGVAALDKAGKGSGTALMSNIDSFPKLKAYLNDYSNKDNFRAVNQDISSAQKNIRFAISLANQPGNSDLAIETYNNALAQLRRSERQLKLLERDPKAYIDDVKLKRSELESYMRDVVPGKTLQMQNALIKPDPTYYDNEVNQIITGGE